MISTSARLNTNGVLRAALLVVLLLASCGTDDSEEASTFTDTYDSYFESFSSSYNPAVDLTDLANRSDVVTQATLLDVEDGRFFGESADQPDGVHLNLVFESADATRFYVQIPRPMDSAVDQLRSVLPIGSASVIYLMPNTDPISDGWFNTRDDGNEWFFTTPQGWILDHPERGIVFPLEDNEAEPPFATVPPAADSLNAWVPESSR